MSFYAGERPGISECVELHVFLVPDEQWNSRLNKVSVEAVDSFISAGFIRVYPDINLKAIRDELGVLLGPDKVTDKYSFLKCVGRSLALVKAKQEKDLKAKSFAPPYSPYPELYLLALEENSSSFCSRSLSSDTVIYNTESQTCFPQRPALAPGKTKEPVKFPLIKQGPQQQSALDQSLEDADSYSSLEEREDDSLGCEESVWTEAHNMCRNVDEEFKQYCEKPHSGRAHSSVNAFRTPEALIFKLTQNKREENEKKLLHNRNLTRDSGVPESVKEPDNGKSKVSQTLKKRTRKKPGNEVHVGRMESLLPAACDSTSSPLSLAQYMQKTTQAPSPIRDELLKEIKLVKEKRKQLESTRQELLRKGKDLIALNRHRRNQARDKWKRKYFDTKKATAPLEETLKGLRQELETFYDKLFQQLQAREGRKRQRGLGKPSSTKNNIIIQIMTESCEIDNLKKNMDDAKMKLATEIKLREQAATELRALKAELMQKKSQCSYSGPLTGLTDLPLHFSTCKPV